MDSTVSGSADEEASLVSEARMSQGKLPLQTPVAPYPQL